VYTNVNVHGLFSSPAVLRVVKKTRQLGYNDTGIGLLGTGRYSQILDSIVIGDIFRCDTQYDTDRKICREVRYFSDASEQI